MVSVNFGYHRPVRNRFLQICFALVSCILLSFAINYYATAESTVELRDGSDSETSNHFWKPAWTRQQHVQPPQAPDAQNVVAFNEFQSTFANMQSTFFQVWLGSWPTCIDWTGAVIGTHVSAGLSTLSSHYKSTVLSPKKRNWQKSPNMPSPGALTDDINRYFAQTGAYYFGENAFAIRTQAYDDMLWVVLGWLENVKFINVHDLTTKETAARYMHDEYVPSWHGKQFEAAFAHRARIFYDLVSSTWNSSSLCGGGLIWDPRKAVYKNTITNTLYISAAVGMYLYHPGDYNQAPFILDQSGANRAPLSPKANDFKLPVAIPHDEKYLNSAIEAYKWLKAVNLTNAQGLYVDGYHISDSSRRRNGTNNPSQCDLRSESVYTYNQGVILSGLRGLWEGTGTRAYLEDGHELVRNVIRATGWCLPHHLGFSEPLASKPSESILDSTSQKTIHRRSESLYVNRKACSDNTSSGPRSSRQWSGLGRMGILEETCDAFGSCSQDAQTFKGIFFHHLTLFCQALPTKEALLPGKTVIADHEVAFLHSASCRSYKSWVEHNARAAMRTKDSKRDLVGMWWTESLLRDDNTNTTTIIINAGDSAQQQLDFNDRGRGRTVETQGSGLAVVRAWWEFLHI